MRYRPYVLAACLSVAAFAQTPTPPSTSSAGDAPLPSPAVRRFSAGVVLNFLVLPVFKDRTEGYESLGPPVTSSVYTTNDLTKRFGYGITAQIALTDHISLNGDLIMRRIGYVVSSETIEGLDLPNTIADDRRFISRNENTEARFYDLPITARWYTKDRNLRGVRAFLEGGLAWRRVSNIETSIQTIVNAGDPTTANTPAVAATRTVRGFTAGFGVHAVDPIGIRIMPMVRYTRWMGETFQSFTTVTERNQIDAGVCFTF